MQSFHMWVFWYGTLNNHQIDGDFHIPRSRLGFSQLLLLNFLESLGLNISRFFEAHYLGWFTLCYFKSNVVSTLTLKCAQLVLHSHLGNSWTMLPLASSCCRQNQVSIAHFYISNSPDLFSCSFFNMHSLTSNSKQMNRNSLVKCKADLHISNQLCTSVAAHSHWVIPRLSHQHPQSHSTAYISVSKTHAAV